MRTDIENSIVESNLGDTFSKEQFLSQSELSFFINYFKQASERIHKTTGPVTSQELRDIFTTVPEFISLFDRIKSIIGECEIYTAFYFHVDTPHVIHNDDDKSYPVVYKAITIPLELDYEDTNENYPYLCFFDQYYLKGPAKFFKGGANIASYYNQPVYDYADVKNKSSTLIDKQTYQQYLTHIKIRHLEELSLKSVELWKPTNAIFFDCVRLHCASDFKAAGIKKKLGLSIFTKLKISADVADAQLP
jgi:hypothetical protein